jgi:hypothetical protein
MNSKQINEPWYSARCLFLDAENETYEERIILIEAKDEEEAFKKAKKEALAYSENANSQFLNYIDIFHLFDRDITDGCEIYSFMRESDGLSRDDYISHFLSTGKEVGIRDKNPTSND